MQEGAVVDDQRLVLLRHLLLLEDALERGKDALGNQLADDLVISNALLLESWIREVAVLVELGEPVLHNCVVERKDDIEQLITTMVPLSEGFYPRIERF